MAQEIFKVKNISGDVLEIRDFGILLDNNVTVDLGNYDLAVLSDEINGMLLNSELVRIVNDVEITNVNNIYTVSAHTHTASNITDLVEYSGFTNYYLNTDIDTLLSSKTDSGTSYTKSETDTLLNTKANTSTTLSGYGITDAQPLDSDLTAIATLSGTSGLLKKTAADTWTLDTTAYTTNLGTVTSVGGTGTVSGLSLSGTVTTSGNLTLGGTLAVTASNFASQTANTVLIAPNGVAGVPTFRVLVANDIPSLDAVKISTGTLSGGRGVVSGSATASFVRYNGTVVLAGTFDGSTTTPTGTLRLNYGGYFYPTQLNLVGTTDTATAATHYFVETGTDGFVRPKTLANVTTEIVTSASVISGLGYTPYDATNPNGYTTNLGTVTSVGGTGTVSGLSLSGTVTTSGSLTLGGTLSVTASDFSSQTANTVLSAPNGTAGVPTFRLLVANDIPSLSWSKITTGTPTTLTGYGITDAQPLDADLTAISGLVGTIGLLKKTAADTWTLDTTAYTTNLGTVTSVGGTGTVSGLSLSGSVTTSGNLTLGGTLSVTPSNFASQTANTILSAPNGTTGVPTFRLLVENDIPSLSWSKITSGTPTTLSGYGITDAATSTHTHTFASLTSKPTTLSGYGITDAQSLDDDLTAIASLIGTTGLLRKTATNTWSLDTTAYTTNLGTVTSVGGTGTVSGLSLSGTVTTSGSLTLSGTLSVTSSNFASQTANTVLIAPNGSAGVPTFRLLVANDIPSLDWSKITTGKPTTLSGYGITDAQPLDGDLTAIAALSGTTGLLRKTALNTWSLDTTAYTTNLGTVTSVGGTGTVSGISLSGTVTTSGNLTLSGTLAVTASNFASQTANTVLIAPNGTAGVPTFRLLVANDIPSLDWAKITTGKPTTLSGYGITDAYTKTETDTLLNAKLNLSGGTVTGILNISNATASTTTTNGALVVTGGVGIGGALNVGGNSTITGSSYLGNVTTDVNQQNFAVIDITTKKLANSGTKFNVYGSEYQYVESLAASNSTAVTPTYTAKVTMTTTSLPSGTYKIQVAYGYLHSVTNNDILIRTTLNGTIMGTLQRVEVSDATTVDYSNRVFYRALSGVNTIALEFTNEAGATATLYDATIELIRVA